jgi:hypothetical protein
MMVANKVKAKEVMVEKKWPPLMVVPKKSDE